MTMSNQCAAYHQIAGQPVGLVHDAWQRCGYGWRAGRGRSDAPRSRRLLLRGEAMASLMERLTTLRCGYTCKKSAQRFALGATVLESFFSKVKRWSGATRSMPLVPDKLLELATPSEAYIDRSGGLVRCQREAFSAETRPGKYVSGADIGLSVRRAWSEVEATFHDTTCVRASEWRNFKL
jgi:hypothetical protein